MNYERKCPSCESIIEYSCLGNYNRAKNKNSLCKKCANYLKSQDFNFKKTISESRKKYFKNISHEEHEKQKMKISESNRLTYLNKTDEWKEWFKNTSSERSKRNWKDPEYKKRMKSVLSKNNWAKRDDVDIIKKKQIESRIKNNNGKYSKGPGRCKEFNINGIKCYGTSEKKYIELLIENGLEIPKNIDESIITPYGSYSPDFEFDNFYVEVKSEFTLDVLYNKKSYSKNKPSNPDQISKISWVNQNIKKIKIALILNNEIKYLDI